MNQGLSAMDSIRSTTSLAAEALKLERIGIMKQGNLADLIVVDGNPLKDIRILEDQQKIHIVMKDRRIFRSL